jgi:hypothetical protein
MFKLNLADFCCMYSVQVQLEASHLNDTFTGQFSHLTSAKNSINDTRLEIVSVASELNSTITNGQDTLARLNASIAMLRGDQLLARAQELFDNATVTFQKTLLLQDEVKDSSVLRTHEELQRSVDVLLHCTLISIFNSKHLHFTYVFTHTPSLFGSLSLSPPRFIFLSFFLSLFVLVFSVSLSRSIFIFLPPY